MTFGYERSIIKSELKFIFHSPLIPSTGGYGETKEEKMKNFKKLILVVLFGFMAFFMVACQKNSEIERNRDVVEILYERVLPVVSPQYDDPTSFLVFSYDHGGHTPSCKKIDENKWIASVDLPYSNSSNMVSVLDAKIVKSYISTGRRFYVRIRGQDQWIELTRITPHSHGDGEQAEFILNAGVICVNF